MNTIFRWGLVAGSLRWLPINCRPFRHSVPICSVRRKSNCWNTVHWCRSIRMLWHSRWSCWPLVAMRIWNGRSRSLDWTLNCIESAVIPKTHQWFREWSHQCKYQAIQPPVPRKRCADHVARMQWIYADPFLVPTLFGKDKINLSSFKIASPKWSHLGQSASEQHIA